MARARYIAPILVLFVASGARATDIVVGDVPSIPGPDYLFDDAATGATTFTDSGSEPPSALIVSPGGGLYVVSASASVRTSEFHHYLSDQP